MLPNLARRAPLNAPQAHSTIRTAVRADRGAGFKKCCMRSGRFDGSERNYYFRK